MYFIRHFFFAKHVRKVMLDQAIAFDNWVTLVNDYSITMLINVSTSTSSL